MTSSLCVTETVSGATLAAIADADAFGRGVVRMMEPGDFVLAEPGDTPDTVTERRHRFQNQHPDASTVQINLTVQILIKLCELGSTSSAVSKALGRGSIADYLRRTIDNELKLDVIRDKAPAITCRNGQFCDLVDSQLPGGVRDYLRDR